MLLASEARYQELIRSGHWMWVYDNVNIYQQVRHERQGTYDYTKSFWQIASHIQACRHTQGVLQLLFILIINA